MSASCVIDASALLAFLYGEPGADLVRPLIPTGFLSTINQSEVLQKNLARNQSNDALFDTLQSAGLTIVPFDARHADLVAALWIGTRAYGLSLADRACLALAKTMSAPVYTADQAWAAAGKVVGVEVRLIR